MRCCRAAELIASLVLALSSTTALSQFTPDELQQFAAKCTADLVIEQQNPRAAPAIDNCILARSQNYPCTTYKTKAASDGWILTLQRINTTAKPKGVVLFQHGTSDSSALVLANGKTQSLPFILADLGYDVWLGNNRGNGQSMDNNKYRRNQSEYWDWSWHEMGVIDLPMEIDLVLQTTGASKLSFIGHSQGTTQAFVAFTEVPSLASKVNLFIALAPCAFTKHTKNQYIQLMAAIRADEIMRTLGVTEVSIPDFVRDLLAIECTIDAKRCFDTIAFMMGPTTHWNVSRTSEYVKHFPAPTSAKCFMHWFQAVRNDVFQKFDYGNATENIKHYGQPTPPPYDLSKFPLTLPLALFTGTNDYMATPTDVATLRSKLPKSVVIFDNNEPTYAHADFILGFDANKITFPHIIRLLDSRWP